MTPTELFKDNPEVANALSLTRVWAISSARYSFIRMVVVSYIDGVQANRVMGMSNGLTQDEADAEQFDYILGNIKSWRGAQAQKVKKVLKAFQKEVRGYE